MTNEANPRISPDASRHLQEVPIREFRSRRTSSFHLIGLGTFGL